MSANGVNSTRVLLIDPNVFFARRVTDALKQEGFDVVHSTQSAYALTMLEYDTPAAILCSTTMREINAYELPMLVHADPRMDQHGQLIGVDLAHGGGAENGRGRVVLKHGQGIGRLGAVHHVKALLFERVGDPPRKKH